MNAATTKQEKFGSYTGEIATAKTACDQQCGFRNSSDDSIAVVEPFCDTCVQLAASEHF